jgi:DNA replication protein DnaC
MVPKGLWRELDDGDMERINLPKELWTADVAGVPASIKPNVEKYLANLWDALDKGTGLMLCGLNGVGKTGTAALILKAARAIGFSGYFTSLDELHKCVKDNVAYDDSFSVLQWCRKVDVLVLDGLNESDFTRPYPFPITELEALLTHRRDSALATILTTQMKAEDLSETGFMSKTKGALIPVMVTGPNKREGKEKEIKSAFWEVAKPAAKGIK